GFPGVIVDGMDVMAVYHAADAAVRRARQGEGPTLLECKTYRFQGHSRGDPGGYRSKDELALWKARDPIPKFRRVLQEQYAISDSDLADTEQQCQKQVEQAVEFARASPEPSPESLYEHVFAPRPAEDDRGPLRSEPAAPPVGGDQLQTGATKQMSMVEALRDGVRRGLGSAARLFILGEDVGVAGGFGGGFTVTLGLAEEFGHERVMDTPISEIAIIGAAVGAALTGMRPVAEMQYGDFVFGA